MSGIKSAYELAMERAKNIKVDPVEIKRKEREQIGKEAGSSFLNKPKYDLEKFIKETGKDDITDILNGLMWVFKKNITLPYSTSDVDKLLKIKEGVLKLTDKEDEANQIFTQLTTIFQQYIESSKTLLEQCKEQFAPRLQQKAMEIAQQTGQLVPIEPETDRDFIEFHKQNQDEVDKQFKNVVNQLTDAMDTLT